LGNGLIMRFVEPGG